MLVVLKLGFAEPQGSMKASQEFHEILMKIWLMR